MLEQGTGTVRFDLVDGRRTDRWLVTLDKGDVSVSRKNAPADCVVRAETTLFEAMTSGRARTHGLGSESDDPYALRHIYATLRIAAHDPTLYIESSMGTGLVGKVYGASSGATRARVH